MYHLLNAGLRVAQLINAKLDNIRTNWKTITIINQGYFFLLLEKYNNHAVSFFVGGFFPENSLKVEVVGLL